MASLAAAFGIAASRPSPARFLLARALVRSGFCKWLKIKRDGYSLWFFPSSLSLALWELGPQERSDEDALIRGLLRPGDVFVDVGANVGSLSVVAGQAVGATGRVVAIEPHPRIYRFLRENLSLNGILAETRNCAAGDRDGSVRFSDGRDDDLNGVCAHGPLVVPVRPLDELLAGVGRVRLLKIDVEGFELQVLRGARSVLSRTDYVYFECWDEHAEKFGYSARDMLTLLGDAGFLVSGCGGAPAGPPFPRCVNLLAVRQAWRPARGARRAPAGGP